MKSMYNETYLKFVATFLIAMLMTIPFYISDALAQPALPDPVQSCIEKGEKTEWYIELLENDIIDTLERILRILHAISSIWETAVVVLDVLVLLEWDSLIPTAIADAIRSEIFRNAKNAPLTAASFGLMTIHYLATCELPAGLPTACNLKVPVPGTGQTIGVGPFDNLWTAIGCWCLPGILFNLRKLETVYKVHNCCIQEACQNGISLEACEREFEKGVCMAVGKGAMISMIANILMGLASKLIADAMIEKFGEEVVLKIGTIISLATAPFRIQSLIASFEKISEAFDEPNCEDLGFDSLSDRHQ